MLGRRWALRLAWELRDGPLGFRNLQSRCDAMSSSVLSQRLAELRAAWVVAQQDDRYGLTAEGGSRWPPTHRSMPGPGARRSRGNTQPAPG